MEIAEKARLVATNAHAEVNQVRKYSKKPYIVHPKAVVELLSNYTDNENIFAAAWLHDTIEDTNLKYENILEEFGSEIATLVLELTELSKEDYPDREERKKLEIERLKGISADAQTVKYADIFDNIIDIVDEDPEKAKSYLQMKMSALENMKDGNAELRKLVIERAKKELGRI